MLYSKVQYLKLHRALHVISMLVLISVFIGMWVSQITHAQERRIIDVHHHALYLDALPSHLDTIAGYERPQSVRELRSRSINQLERFNILKAVTSGEPELVKNYKKAAPGRIVKGLWIPIGLTGDSLNRYLKFLPKWYRQDKFKVIGEVLTQYSGITPNDPILEPMWSFAEQEDIPVGIHIGPTFTKTSGYTPLKMKEVLEKHPTLRVYVMHAGYPKIDDMIQLMSEYPQVYVDLAGMLFGLPHEKSHQYLKKLVDAGFADRIMFGSDQQVWPQSIEESIQVIENADFLTEEQKQYIFLTTRPGSLESARTKL